MKWTTMCQGCSPSVGFDNSSISARKKKKMLLVVLMTAISWCPEATRLTM